MSEETWQRARRGSSTPDLCYVFSKRSSCDGNLSDGLSEHLLESGTRAAALLKGMSRYLKVEVLIIFQNNGVSLLTTIFYHFLSWVNNEHLNNLYSESPGLGLRVALLCGDGDLNWDKPEQEFCFSRNNIDIYFNPDFWFTYWDLI